MLPPSGRQHLPPMQRDYTAAPSAVTHGNGHGNGGEQGPGRTAQPPMQPSGSRLDLSMGSQTPDDANTLDLQSRTEIQFQYHSHHGAGDRLDSPSVVHFNDPTAIHTPTLHQTFARNGFTRTNLIARAPHTADGKAMLKKTQQLMALPPDEWADEVRELQEQFIECMEELSAREGELNECYVMIKYYEGHLATMRQQTAMLYKEHLEYTKQVKDSDKKKVEELKKHVTEKDKLAIKVKHLESTLSDVQANMAPGKHAALARNYDAQARNMMALEANELVLRRECASLQQQIEEQTAARVGAEKDAIEVEMELKSRLLYLEEWKQGASEKLERLQAKLDESVPEEKYTKVAMEVDDLREDYLNLLTREAQARYELARNRDAPIQLLKLRDEKASLEAELDQAKLDARIKQDAMEEALGMYEQHKVLIQDGATAQTMEDLNEKLATVSRDRADMMVKLGGMSTQMSYLEECKNQANIQVEKLREDVLRLSQSEAQFRKE